MAKLRTSLPFAQFCKLFAMQGNQIQWLNLERNHTCSSVSRAREISSSTWTQWNWQYPPDNGRKRHVDNILVQLKKAPVSHKRSCERAVSMSRKLIGYSSLSLTNLRQHSVVCSSNSTILQSPSFESSVFKVHMKKNFALPREQQGQFLA